VGSEQLEDYAFDHKKSASSSTQVYDDSSWENAGGEEGGGGLQRTSVRETRIPFLICLTGERGSSTKPRVYDARTGGKG